MSNFYLFFSNFIICKRNCKNYSFN